MSIKVFSPILGRERPAHLEIGRWAEQRARRYLIDKGMNHLHSNYRCKSGEVDLIMDDGGCTVFVEVRYRRNHRFGGALASVDRRKISRLRNAAQHYLQRFDPSGQRPCRFDIVIPELSGDGADCLWVKNAF